MLVTRQTLPDQHGALGGVGAEVSSAPALGQVQEGGGETVAAVGANQYISHVAGWLEVSVEVGAILRCQGLDKVDQLAVW